MQDFVYLPKGGAANAILKMWNVTVSRGVRGFKDHSHTAFELSVLKEGSGIYAVGGKEIPFNGGDVAVFCSNKPHCITNVEKELKLLNLQFEPRLLWGARNDSLSERAQSMCFFHNSDFPYILKADTPIAQTVKALILQIENEFKEKKSEYRFAIKNLLNSILIILIRQGNYLSPNADTVDREHLKIMRKAMDYIENNLSEPLYLEDIAQRVGMSPSYFSTLFRKISSNTLTHYINERRISLAMHLLTCEGESTMLSIAVKCGYNNTANFNKVFKSIVGVTPTEYKKYGGVPLS